MRKDWFTYCLRVFVLLVLTCNVSGAYADVTISTNTTHSSEYTYSGNVTLNKDRTLTINSKVTINGNLTSNGGNIVIGAGGSLTVTGDVTISDKTVLSLTDETSKLIVKGDVIVNSEKELKINEDVPGGGEPAGPPPAGGGPPEPPAKPTYSGMIVVQKSMKVGKNAKVFINNNATIIIEDDLNLTSGDNGKSNTEVKVDHSACVTIKKQISGKGRIKIKMPEGGPEGNGYIAVLGYNDDGQSIGNGLGIDQNKITLDVDDKLKQENDFLYIEGVSSLGDVTTNNQGANSAYGQSLENMAIARAAGLLPIELTSFTATATDYGFEFNWVTASEKENDYFTLEYSINGVDFNEIDYVHGAGTTSETSEYEYRWDDAPQIEMIYFRLKQTDYNGEYTYSDVIVSCRKKSAGATRTFRYGPLNLQVVDGELRYIAE